MMTIRRLSVGSGYKYLLKSIAVGDGPEGASISNLVNYYDATGTPPGVFLGAGLAGLNGGRGADVGQVVSAQNLKRMLQDCADPLTGETLGRTPTAKGVGGFDLTFSPSKNVSVAWALADHKTREVISRCHHEAIATVLSYAEAEIFKTRSGRRGCVEEDILGVVAASFTHFDSRDGDPQLHDHVVVLNRVQATSDRQWRTLDSRGLFASAVMLSELHQGALSDLLTTELGWDWEPHARRSSAVPKWEVADVPQAFMEEFSRRSADIVALKDELAAQFEADHGRPPTDVEVRGSSANHLYVDVHYDPDPATGHDGLSPSPSAVEVLERVLQREGGEISATDMIRTRQEQSIASLVAEYETIVALADADRWEALLRDAGLSDSEFARAHSSDAYHTLVVQLREAEL